MHTEPGVAERFISDVECEVAEIMKDPRAEVAGKVSLFFSVYLDKMTPLSKNVITLKI